MPGEVELITKAKSGDKNAFGELYKYYLTRIFRFILYLVREEMVAEDLVQDTFLKAWNSLKNFSHERGTFQAFLYTIARNLVIDTQRKKKHSSLDREGVPEVESTENLFEKLTKSESAHTAHKALLYLPDEERQLLILRYFEDLSYSEIAGIVGLEEGNVRVKVHRLLKILKGYLEE